MEKSNSLAKIALAINVVLIILVIILFTKIGGSDSSEQTSANDSTTDSTHTETKPVVVSHSNGEEKIAFFNMDSLNSKLDLFSEIEKEIKDAGLAAERKMKKKQRDIDSWKAKWEKKGQLLSSEQEQYYKEAEKMQAEAMQFEQNVQLKLAQDQENLMKTYALRISNYCSDFAKENGYTAVFSYQFGQSPWYYDAGLDITNQLASVMNASFKGGETEEATEE